MKFPIPLEALDDRLGIVGTAGSGKTYTAMLLEERVLDRKGRVIHVDPLGVSWGLRLMADGKKKSPYNIVIFGGPHGDLPITEHAGALIGETVAGMAESCILDLSQLGTKAAERRFMLAFTTALYKNANNEPVHLIFDEVDMFAPQKLLDKDGDAARLLGMMETIVRRGRRLGFIPWLISQRPAVINKDILSQVDGLIAMKLTASQDRKALGAWIEGQADVDEGKKILADLPTKQKGEGVVWIPGRSILHTVQFPEKQTFDSSRTPKRGEKLKRVAKLADLDISGLKEKLATVEAETKANDPKALRVAMSKKDGEIVALKRQAASVAVDPKAIESAEQRGFERATKALTVASEKATRDAIADVIDGLREALKPLNSFVEAQAKQARKSPALVVPYVPSTTVARAPAPMNGYARPAKTAIDSDRPLGAERRPLAALCSVYPAGMTEAQWAVASGLKRTGGTWSTYLSRLRMAGRIEERGGEYFATETGIADVGADVQPLPPPGHGLVAYWAEKIPAVGPMLRRLAEVYPEALSREQLAADLNLTATAGTFSTYLSRLRSPGLIEEGSDKSVRAAGSLMEART